MAQTGFTPIQLYSTATAAAAPVAGNLAQGELAINVTDGKLFYKDNLGAVQTLASKGAGTIGGSTTQVQYNLSGALAGSANLTFDGTNLTLGGGTANGVTYLNGSKVLTSGSALTFDGTTLTTVSAGINTQNGLSDTVNPTATTNQIRMGSSGFVSFRLGTAYDFNIDTYNSNSAINVYKVSQVGQHTWSAGGTRVMDLTSTGLGIGTSSPVSALTLANAKGLTWPNASGVFSGTAGSQIVKGNDNNLYFDGYDGAMVFRRASFAESMRLDSSGNLGLGVTPSAWTLLTALQVKNASIYGYANEGGFYSNAYYSGGSWRYTATATATGYDSNALAGGHRWYTAPSGTAGNAISFTQAMTLDASGNLGVGTTSPSSAFGFSRVLELAGTTTALVLNPSNTTSGGGIEVKGAAPLRFTIDNTERARIDSSGNLLVGTTAANARLQIGSASSSGSPTAAGEFVSTGASGAGSGAYINIGWNPSSAYAGAVARISGVSNGSNATELTFSTSSGISSAPTERARIDSSGNLSMAAAGAIVGSRIDPRTVSTASTATLTPDIQADDQFNLTAQAEALTIAAPTGTPVDGNKLIIRILDNGTSRAISWNPTYAVIGTTLPTATTVNKMTYVGCIYNAANTRWDVVAVTTQV